jgi:hypothetical protein
MGLGEKIVFLLSQSKSAMLSEDRNANRCSSTLPGCLELAILIR